MYHKNMTSVKVKNDVDNSVDNVEKVIWRSCFCDADVIKSLLTS